MCGGPTVNLLKKGNIRGSAGSELHSDENMKQNRFCCSDHILLLRTLLVMVPLLPVQVGTMML